MELRIGSYPLILRETESSVIMCNNFIYIIKKIKNSYQAIDKVMSFLIWIKNDALKMNGTECVSNVGK